jgi:hypothetical protein
VAAVPHTVLTHVSDAWQVSTLPVTHGACGVHAPVYVQQLEFAAHTAATQLSPQVALIAVPTAHLSCEHCPAPVPWFVVIGFWQYMPN